MTDVGAPVLEGGLVAVEPLSQTTARIMAVIRAGEGLWVIPVAIATAEPPASLRWILPTLAAFALWAACFAVVALTRGLVTWLIAVDVLVTVAICVGHGHLVPVERIHDGSGWVATIASLCVVGLPLAWRIGGSIPAGLLVVAAFVAGFHIAGYPQLAGVHGLLMVGQLFASAAVMGLVRRSSRTAEAALASTHDARRTAAVDQARRVDESAQLRLVHDTALTTLTLVGTGSIARWSQALARRAAADLSTIDRLGSVKDDPDGTTVELEDLLAAVTSEHADGLAVGSALRRCRVPAQVGKAFAGAVDEALRNVARHAGTGRAEVSLSTADRWVTVEVSDDGRGFDPSTAAAHRFGVRQSIVGRMASAGGQARVESSPGTGTRWILRWRDGD